MPPTGFKPAILASDRPQTLALDRSAIGIGQGFDPLTIQSVASHYTDRAIPAHTKLPDYKESYSLSSRVPHRETPPVT